VITQTPAYVPERRGAPGGEPAAEGLLGQAAGSGGGQAASEATRRGDGQGCALAFIDLDAKEGELGCRAASSTARRKKPFELSMTISEREKAFSRSGRDRGTPTYTVTGEVPTPGRFS
jgi:hypothetical protein